MKLSFEKMEDIMAYVMHHLWLEWLTSPRSAVGVNQDFEDAVGLLGMCLPALRPMGHLRV